jgi:hypothetical protein
VEGTIDGRLDRLGGDIRLGDKSMDRMISREKLKVILTWVVVGVVVIGLGVFLYFVFKK